MSERIFNFSAGPAVLPEPVLQQAREDIWNIFDSGIGILEHSHRGKVFDRVLAEAIADGKAVGSIGDDYEFMFIQGGATMQFAMIPANFLDEQGADYIRTGHWAHQAIGEAELYGPVHIAGDSKDAKYSFVPKQSELAFSKHPRYVHYVSNNTVAGVQFHETPIAPDGVPLVRDASSDIYSEPFDVSKYGMVYGGAQKNLGPSGLAFVIMRKDMLDRVVREQPSMLKYSVHAKKESRFNTPPTFGIYMMGQVFKWIANEGGLEVMAKRNAAKAKVIYDAIDASGFYRGAAREDSRSLMNITFTTPNEELDKRFVADSTAQGLDGLKGHRSIGGMRASLYNAFPASGCDALAQFMKEFERTHG